MAKCISCAAPLPANTNKCLYCGSHNDVDLENRHSYTVIQKQSNQLCPHCDKQLQTIELDINGAFLIARCEHCFGLFFDPGKIDILLESAVSNVFDTNRQHLDNINKDRYQGNKKVKYIKCPVCRTFMSRRVFAYRSGVVVDHCRNHGIWLDSGEITHLLEWKKAGGQLLHERVIEAEKRSSHYKTTRDYTDTLPRYADMSPIIDLFEAVVWFIGKHFTD
jgi:Zn-finger nucleic acid-binding protein